MRMSTSNEPPQTPPASARSWLACCNDSLGGIAFWFAAAATVSIFAVQLGRPNFSPDSWSYLELSNTVFSDFYRVNSVRQFERPLDYGNSFPPLWPILIALVRMLAPVGIYAEYLLNLAVCLA